MESIINSYKILLDGKRNELLSKNPINKIEHNKEILNNKILTLNKNINTILSNKRNEFVLAKQKLELASPLKIMDKGYSISSIKGKVVTKVNEVKVGDKISTRFSDGIIVSEVMEVKEDGR